MHGRVHTTHVRSTRHTYSPHNTRTVHTTDGRSTQQVHGWVHTTRETTHVRCSTCGWVHGDVWPACLMAHAGFIPVRPAFGFPRYHRGRGSPATSSFCSSCHQSECSGDLAHGEIVSCGEMCTCDPVYLCVLQTLREGTCQHAFCGTWTTRDQTCRLPFPIVHGAGSMAVEACNGTAMGTWASAPEYCPTPNTAGPDRGRVPFLCIQRRRRRSALWSRGTVRSNGERTVGAADRCVDLSGRCVGPWEWVFGGFGGLAGLIRVWHVSFSRSATTCAMLRGRGLWALGLPSRTRRGP